MMKVNVILVLILVNFYTKISGAQSLGAAIDIGMVQQLSKDISEELHNVAETVTKRAEVHESFSQAKAVNKNGRKIVEEIAKDIETMVDIRIRAVRRIMTSIQNLPKIHDNDTAFVNYTFLNIRKRDKSKKERKFEKDAENDRKEKASQEPNYVKKVKPNYAEERICIKTNRKEPDYSDDDDEVEPGKISYFGETISLKSREAGVFTPIDVYDKDVNISKIIHRSKGIDKTFEHNYKEEPTIGWQYFCNSTGVFRHYPATEWDFYPMNVYDCRTRHWFTNAASSSKDVIILLEQSGSMKGERLDIAIDVVRNILDTLSMNDFVNVFAFNGSIWPVVKCKECDPKYCKDPSSDPTMHTLVQATSSNIFEFKQALDEIEPEAQTDLAEALEHSFTLLERTRRNGSNCNQVIMLITDGMEYNETILNIFAKYNWNKTNNVRVFSYLIGEMIPEHDYEQVRLMACENRGYYVQIDTKKESREQVLKYIPVVARPLAYDRTQNPIVWSAVYADILDAYKVTNYDWNCKQGDVQRERVINYLRAYDYHPCITDNEEHDNLDYRKYVFMTTVAMPAFEQDKNSSQLMGVAGIDVPLYEFERLFQQFRLGVNGYAFIIDENGNILTHPDFRPFFQNELLKPSYNSVDMVEVELVDDESPARDFDPDLLNMRKSIINDKTTNTKTLPVIQHFDDLRRVMRFKRHYYWKKIDQTPFTVVVTFPDDLSSQIQVPEHDVDSKQSGNSKILKYFQGNYRLHPNWIYCRSLKKNYEDMKLGEIDPDNCEMTPEEELEYFIEKFEKTGWKWKTASSEKGAYKCDQKLIQALLFDAKVTQNYPHDPTTVITTSTSNKKDKKENKRNFFDDYKIETSFIATHSGLLRYKIFINSEDDEESEEELNTRTDEFGKNYRSAIDEDWYKHATYFNLKEPKSFIYSLPFDTDEDSLIMATTTIFARNGEERAPLAVLGFQFPQTRFAKLFQDNLCSSTAEQACFILDDYAYVIASSKSNDEGKFFGAVDRKLMRILINDKIYEEVTLYDYQAVCYQDRDTDYKYMQLVSSATSIFFNPLRHLWTTFIALLASLGKFFTTTAMSNSYVPNLMYPDPEYYYEDDKSAYCIRNKDGTLKQAVRDSTEECLKEDRITLKWSELLIKRHFNKTRPIKCDKYNSVYVLNLDESNYKKPYNKCERPFLVQRIANSNLILLVTKSDCEKNMHYDLFHDMPTDVDHYEMSLFCHKMRNPLYRKHSRSCFTHHISEPKRGDNRTHCGRGNRIEMNNKILLTITLILTMLKFL